MRTFVEHYALEVKIGTGDAQISKRGGSRPAEVWVSGSGRPHPNRCEQAFATYASHMILIVGTIRLPPANLDRARPAMIRMIETSRREDGCEGYVYAEDVAEPGLIHVIEQWRDQAALDHHFKTDHIAEWRSAWGDLGIGDRNLFAYQTGEAVPT
jgi:quinol monooxygenase YgiN